MSDLSLRPNEPNRPFRFGSPQTGGNGNPPPTHAAVIAERARQNVEAKAPAPPEKIVVRDLRFYYKNFEALKFFQCSRSCATRSHSLKAKYESAKMLPDSVVQFAGYTAAFILLAVHELT